MALGAVLAAALAVAGRARAEGLTLTLEPNYALVETRSRDAAGKLTLSESQSVRNRGMASFDRRLTDYLTTSLGGTFADNQTWSRSDGLWSETHDRQGSGYGRLALSTPVLTLGLGAERRELIAFTPSAPTIVTDAYTGDALWRPVDLPELQLSAMHTDTVDHPRRDRDASSDSASLALRWRQPRYELRYLLSWNQTQDRLHGVDTAGVDQSAIGTRNDAFFGGRITSYLSGKLSTRSGTIRSRGGGGTVTRLQVPVATLSAVVSLPATSQNVQLQPNPSLMDGNTQIGAAVNVGWGLAALGDRDVREVGARFADVVTDVNTFYVWFDKRLSPEVGRALAGAVQVWRSDDDQRWTEVTGAAGRYDPAYDTRVEISFAQIRSRYLKVTLRPLAASVTLDTTFRELVATELQTLLVLPVDQVPRREGSLSLSGSGIAKAVILSRPDLSYDVSASLAHQTDPGLTTYSVVNGVSLAHRLSRTLGASARAARQDVDDGTGHQGGWQWSGGLAWNPLSTAFLSVAYNGSTNDQNHQTTHAVTGLGRADWYDGITSQLNGAGSISTQGETVSRTGQVTGTTSFSPNPYVTLSIGGLYSRTLVSNPTIGDVMTQYGRADGAVSLYPAPSLTATGTISRVFIGDRPTTLAAVQGSFAPLRSDVQVGLSYSRNLDTEAKTMTEQFSSSLRWNIRTGLSLTAAYTILDSSSPIQTTNTRALTGNLIIVL